MDKHQLTACEVESMELSDNEQLAAVLLKRQVAEPLEDRWHVLGAPVERNRRNEGVLPSALATKLTVFTMKEA